MSIPNKKNNATVANNLSFRKNRPKSKVYFKQQKQIYVLDDFKRKSTYRIRPICNNSIQPFHTFLCNSQNYHPRGALDDPMHCCPRPKAEGNSASGHPQHRGGDSFDCCTERYEIVVLLPNSEDTCYWKYFLNFE